MANINKIRLSGQTYNIEDSNAPKTVELTQAQYDALAVKDPNTFYIITDAQGADLSQYYTSAQTESAITQAVSGKQDTLVSGTNIKTINNESLLGSGNIDIQGGGGKAINAGTNISVTTGETADTINCTLPMSTDSVKKIVVDSNYSSFVTSDAAITANSLSNSILIGNNTFKIKGLVKGKINNNLIIGSYNTSKLTNGTSPALEGNLVVGSNNQINNSYSLLVGYNSIISRGYQFAIGYNQKPKNEYEISLGAFNVSSSGSSTFGDSGNTLFSVGNGTADNARHNAFEIRQNGDIYLTKDGQDVKLQDQLGGGGGSSYTAGTGIDITNDVISVSGVVMSSAVTSAVTSGSTDVVTSGGVYDQLGGLKLVKLTQSAYDALSPDYDSNTLYIIKD